MKKTLSFLAMMAAFLVAATAVAETPNFTIRKFSENEFSTFTKVFGEMRGPLRSEILKDKKTDFENADPLKYVMKVKDAKDVKKALKDAGITWDQFEELMGNVLMAYFSIQPEKTKAALIKQLADYGLFMNVDAIPEEYRSLVTEVLKTDAGAALAGAALEMVIQIPPENVAIAKKEQKQLDRFFYTKYWKDKLG
ncbi:MAG: hypothetical protein V2A66_06630 [Pseudomonadota bacterium]